MNPYESMPARAFWRAAVAEPGMAGISDLWRPAFAIGQDDPVITAGSCFAANLGRALLDRGWNWWDAEPAPPGLTGPERRARGYGAFSFRTGNIYTAAVARQWLAWALGRAEPPTEAWAGEGRFFDPFRPSIEPAGFASAEEMLESRLTTLAAIRRAVTGASVLIFTVGLTESWRDAASGDTYPVCPGTVRGEFDPDRHVFHEFTFAEVYEDLVAIVDLCRAANPGLRVVLTVSPVPLTATATGGHVLTATVHAKSVLRAAVGQVAAERDDVDYFPSYEIVAGFPARAAFFEPNLRTVTPDGVDFVVRHFVGALAGRPAARPRRTGTQIGGDPCDDAVLDYYSPR
ncbi:GSCFA domain-containing protein [Micromonospora fluostatini]|uniref:GSCFA domain-containing protein n=1 Tax=Micromonospora sp. JCM 30529 TaxID=3421643 RepID=UPI003D17B86E